MDDEIIYEYKEAATLIVDCFGFRKIPFQPSENLRAITSPEDVKLVANCSIWAQKLLHFDEFQENQREELIEVLTTCLMDMQTLINIGRDSFESVANDKGGVAGDFFSVTDFLSEGIISFDKKYKEKLPLLPYQYFALLTMHQILIFRKLVLDAYTTEEELKKIEVREKCLISYLDALSELMIGQRAIQSALMQAKDDEKNRTIGELIGRYEKSFEEEYKDAQISALRKAGKNSNKKQKSLLVFLKEKALEILESDAEKILRKKTFVEELLECYKNEFYAYKAQGDYHHSLADSFLIHGMTVSDFPSEAWIKSELLKEGEIYWPGYLKSRGRPAKK